MTTPLQPKKQDPLTSITPPNTRTSSDADVKGKLQGHQVQEPAVKSEGLLQKMSRSFKGIFKQNDVPSPALKEETIANIKQKLAELQDPNSKKELQEKHGIISDIKNECLKIEKQADPQTRQILSDMKMAASVIEKDLKSSEQLKKITSDLHVLLQATAYKKGSEPLLAGNLQTAKSQLKEFESLQETNPEIYQSLKDDISNLKRNIGVQEYASEAQSLIATMKYPKSSQEADEIMQLVKDKQAQLKDLKNSIGPSAMAKDLEKQVANKKLDFLKQHVSMMTYSILAFQNPQKDSFKTTPPYFVDNPNKEIAKLKGLRDEILKEELEKEGGTTIENRESMSENEAEIPEARLRIERDINDLVKTPIYHHHKGGERLSPIKKDEIDEYEANIKALFAEREQRIKKMKQAEFGEPI